MYIVASRYFNLKPKARAVFSQFMLPTSKSKFVFWLFILQSVLFSVHGLCWFIIRYIIPWLYPVLRDGYSFCFLEIFASVWVSEKIMSNIFLELYPEKRPVTILLICFANSLAFSCLLWATTMPESQDRFILGEIFIVLFFVLNWSRLSESLTIGYKKTHYSE